MYRSDVVGSLLRPAYLKKAREEHDARRLAQYGFASTMEGNLLPEADQEAKLRLVVETASEVWGESRSAESSKVKGKSV